MNFDGTEYFGQTPLGFLTLSLPPRDTLATRFDPYRLKTSGQILGPDRGPRHTLIREPPAHHKSEKIFHEDRNVQISILPQELVAGSARGSLLLVRETTQGHDFCDSNNP